jgi:CopA family copper-resistance protein
MLGMAAVLDRLLPAFARTGAVLPEPSAVHLGSATRSSPVVELTLAHTRFQVRGTTIVADTINGTVPGPLLRFREGDDVTIRVANRLGETSSIHWHGLLVPPEMDGVPGVSFAGIPAGTTFTYRFPLKQYGTYWYHSHSGFQELRGIYAPIIIEPLEPDPTPYDREHVVMLSEWSRESPPGVVANLKKQAGYYNFQRRTVAEFLMDASQHGLGPTLDNYLMWSQMRMDPTDFADVSGYALAYLLNGRPPDMQWTGLFRAGERVRLRIINAATMTFFDVRIPDLPMTVVQADGQNVQPVTVDEFRMGPAETYDVIVTPAADRAYTIFAETMDRSGYARGTLAPRPGMTAPVPPRRPRPIRTMQDMGMRMEGTGHDMPGMEGMGHEMPGMDAGCPAPSGAAMPEMDPHAGHAPARDSAAARPAPMRMPADTAAADSAGHAQHGAVPREVMPEGPQRPPPATVQRSPVPGSTPVPHGPDHHGTGNQAVPDQTVARPCDPGTGLGDEDRRILTYADLRARTPYPDRRPPERTLELHVTGHMERFLWSFDGQKYSDAPAPIPFRYGERLRWTFVNDTMMEHPLHLHGMFMELENGTGDFLPRKHTVIVKPAERVSVLITADAPGHWAFHCHLLLHMEAGMFRVVHVTDELATR